MTRVLRVAALLALQLIALAMAADTMCADVGFPAPTVATLYKSKTNSSEAVLLQPSCKYEVIPVEIDKRDASGKTTMLNCSLRSIERIESFPSAQRLIFLRNPFTKGADFSKDTKIEDIVMSWSQHTSLDRFSFPTQMRGIDLEGNSLVGLAKGTLPEGLGRLFLNSNKLKSLENFYLPASIDHLYLGQNQFKSINFDIPSKLVRLSMDGNPIPVLEKLKFPSSVTTLSFSKCGLDTIRGVQFPAGLTSFKLDSNTITSFEIRESDARIFKKIVFPEGTITQSSCEDEDAKKIELSGGGVACVLSDKLFNKKYGFDSSDSSEGGSSSTPSDGTSGGMPDETSGGVAEGSRASNSGSNSPSGTESIDGGQLGAVFGPSSSGTGGPLGTNATSTSAPAASVSIKEADASKNSTVITVIAIIGGVLFIVVAAIGYRVFVVNRARKGNNEDPAFKYHGDDSSKSRTLAGTMMTGMTEYSGTTREYLRNDVRCDEELIPLRIAQNEIHLIESVAKGGFGVIYSATFRGRNVAVKQLLPEKTKNNNAIKSFMDEIRMCAKLDHPRIVEFVGISWSSLMDIAVVIEYMAGGDLATALQAQDSANPQHWFESSAMLKSKTLLALDMIEALVYLHSFASPILHRDLKARNVLLSADGEAKLSDFGISRELSLDETMTGEVGTVAWIAPEVLQGERYSEKADIYSFGVLLVELDTCRHPYSKDIDSDESGRLSTSHTNTRIAMMVSAGILKPVTSRGCPRGVKDLVARCLSYDPHERPSGVEIHFELRKLLERMSTTT